MLGNLAVVDAGDIHDGAAAILRVTGRMNMKKHEVTIGRASHDRGACLRICFEVLGKERYLLVSNALAGDVRFPVDSVLYRFDG